MDKRFRIFILGAGFSRPAGLPLGNELWAEVYARASRIHGGENQVTKDVGAFIRYKALCDHVQIGPEEIDIEELLGFLDVEHSLWLRGSDTFSQQGNESQLMIRRIIGQIITELTPAIPDIPNLYYDFVRCLTPDDTILTFNYDILLERCLASAGIPFRRFPLRLKSYRPLGSEVDSSHQEVRVLKLHGSVDWFDRSPYDEALDVTNVTSPGYIPRDPIFGRDRRYTAIPIVEGPYSPDSPLMKVYRVEQIESLYATDGWGPSPLILAPSSNKFLYASVLRDLWSGLGEAGGLNLSMAIIGFSLPSHDEYIRQMLFRLTQNYTEYEPDLDRKSVV